MRQRRPLAVESKVTSAAFARSAWAGNSGDVESDEPGLRRRTSVQTVGEVWGVGGY